MRCEDGVEWRGGEVRREMKRIEHASGQKDVEGRRLCHRSPPLDCCCDASCWGMTLRLSALHLSSTRDGGG